MKKITLIVAVLLAAVLAFGAFQLVVSGIGVGVSPDQATADQQADQQASSNLQLQCSTGMLVSSNKTSDQCGNLGSDDNPNYMCTVSYVGSCRIGR